MDDCGAISEKSNMAAASAAMGTIKLRKSFPSGEENYVRFAQGQLLHLDVIVPQHVGVTQVAIHTNLTGEWRDMRLHRIEGCRYVMDFPLARMGRFQFRVKYRLQDDGWHWDPAPYSYLMVDASGIDNLRIYTLIPAVSGGMAHWRDWVHHIRAMGFNCIHLLPIARMSRSRSPYAAADLFAVDNLYVDAHNPMDGLEQFDAFVQHCRASGMKLCIDLVLNHVGLDNALLDTHPEWFVPDEGEGDGFKRAGWHDGKTWHPWSDLVLLNYDHPCEAIRAALWDYMCRYALLWSGFAAATNGMLRLDNLHSGHPAFIGRLLREIRRRHPHLMVLAELFADSADKRRWTWRYGVNLLLGTHWEHPFVPQLRQFLRDVHMDRQIRYFLPMNTHDSGAPAQEFGTSRATIPRYVLGALMGCGATGMTQGAEYGVRKRLEIFGGQSIFQPPDHCDDYIDPIRRINAMHEQWTIFRKRGNVRFLDKDHEAIIAVWRDDDATRHGFLVICNFDIHKPHDITMDVSDLVTDDCTLEDVFGRSRYKLDRGGLHVTLDPCGVCVLEAAGMRESGRGAEGNMFAVHDGS